VTAPAFSPSSVKRIHLIQGQFQVRSDEDVVLTTTLGSCVAACVRDPFVRVGGMNHFLLPEGDDSHGLEALRYGVHLMEVLINALLSNGAKRNRLEAKLFGGARMTARLADIGGKNVDFAESFLRREGIELLPGSVRGDRARRVQFWPASGRARQMLLAPAIGENMELRRPPLLPKISGDVELF
jgi:chemotaxis protein CheD